MTDTATPLEAHAVTAPPSADEFAERVLGSVLGWIDTMSIHIGDRLGWYDALAASGPLSPAALAAVTGTAERYAREWLEQQAASGILTIEETGLDRRFALPAGAAEVLTDRASLAYTAPLARMMAASGAQLPALLDAYRSGGGVSWEQLGVDAREAQADANRPWLDGVADVFGRHPHLHARLSREQARIADIGAGAGWSAIALAQAYPDLRVDAFDVDAPSIAMARRNAAEAGVADRVTFHLEDAARIAAHGQYDGVVAFECLHDMPHPQQVLRGVSAALTEDGFAVVMDEAVGEELAPHADELERLMYGFSLFVCLPDGMSHPQSAGTGTVMRPDVLRGYAREAGFAHVSVLEDDYGFWRFYELHRS